MYKEASPFYTRVKFWISEFKRDRTSILDEARSGRLKSVVTDETVNKVHDLVMKIDCAIGAALADKRPKASSCGDVNLVS